MSAVPPNTVATAWVPTTDAAGVTEGGRPIGEAPGVVAVGEEPGCLTLTLGSGIYEFDAALPEDAVPVAHAAPAPIG
jgi:alpha-L-rhamnosidase